MATTEGTAAILATPEPTAPVATAALLRIRMAALKQATLPHPLPTIHRDQRVVLQDPTGVGGSPLRAFPEMSSRRISSATWAMKHSFGPAMAQAIMMCVVAMRNNEHEC